jgi:hypothetical protein
MVNRHYDYFQQLRLQVERGVTTQRGWLRDSTTNLVKQWSINKISTAKKVGGVNEYEINSISAGDIEIYILHMLNCLKMDFKMIYLDI